MNEIGRRSPQCFNTGLPRALSNPVNGWQIAMILSVKMALHPSGKLAGILRDIAALV
jgi:hypothetical protein